MHQIYSDSLLLSFVSSGLINKRNDRLAALSRAIVISCETVHSDFFLVERRSPQCFHFKCIYTVSNFDFDFVRFRDNVFYSDRFGRLFLSFFVGIVGFGYLIAEGHLGFNFRSVYLF